MANTKRAYSDAAKQEREQKIITAAETLLMERGYYAINMEQVAQAAGLAKGTVYLYFQTKEELFLTVFERQTTVWLNEVEQLLLLPIGETSKTALVDLMTKSISNKPLLTRLTALSSIIFEYNVPLERLREHKLWIYGALDELGRQLAEKFHLPPMQAIQFLFRMIIFVAGLEGFAHPAPVTKQVYEQESSIPKFDFENELRAMMWLLLNTDSDTQ